MRRIISVSLLALALTAGIGQVPAFAADPKAPLELAANAPDRHVVVPGDTLWSISARFLKQPYRWPELWRMNEDEIKNPHRIYPGQVLVLERDADGRPRLRVGGASGSGSQEAKLSPKVYETFQPKEIPSIPFDLIQPYLAKPLVMDVATMDELPRVVSAENRRELLGAGDRIYVGNLKERAINWNIYRRGAELKDPDTRELLGYESTHVGTAVLKKEGNPATLEITRSSYEIQLGNMLTKHVDPEVIAFVPRPVQAGIKARILTIYGASGLGGQYSIIGISKGRADGLEVGHVMAYSVAGREVAERYTNAKTTVRTDYKTPDELSGHVFIFQVFERIAYALVLSADTPIMIGDVVHSPE